MKRKALFSRLVVSCFLCCSFGLFPLFAQEEGVDTEADTVVTLGDVIVSATRTEIPVKDAVQSVSVISSKQIESSPFERVEDMVRSAPGVHNFRHFGMQKNGIVSPIMMRGVGKNRTLILVDGVPQNDNFNNAIAWIAWGHIPKESIERIEIVRGPGSALYGSDGMGGVINIITKKPDPKRKTSVRGEYGNAYTGSGHGFHSQVIGNLGFMIAGGYEHSDGFYMTEDPESHEIKRYRDLGKALGKISYDFSENTYLSFTALYYNYNAGQGRENFYNEMLLDQYWMNLVHDGDMFNLQGTLYLSRADKTAFQDKKPNYDVLHREEKMKGTHTWGGDLQGTLVSFKNVNVTLGSAYKDVNWNYEEEHHVSTREVGAEGKQQFVSPFISADLRLFDESLILNAGMRYDWVRTSDARNYNTEGQAGQPAYDTSYGDSTANNISPKMGLAWHVNDKTTLRASGGKGFRVPSLFELYKVHIRQAGLYYREANPDLEPETIWSYDAGVERTLTNSLWAKLTFYQSFAKNYIGDRLTRTEPAGPDTRYFYVLDNISEVNIYGIEAETSWEMIEYLVFSANYTFNVSRVKKDTENQDLEGNYLPNDPRHSVHAGIAYSNPKIINVNIMTNHYAGIYYDNENTLKQDYYWTVDLFASRNLYKGLKVYMSAENIFDKKYAIMKRVSKADTTAPGVIISGGLKYEF